jgi:polyphosphate kinase 2
MRQNSSHIKENIDPELQWEIDNQYRTNPELRDEILSSIGDDELESYVVNVEHGDVKLKYPPEQILEKLTGLSDLGNIVTTMRGGNGVAIITDKDLVVKITGDKAEYITAKELQDTNSNHIVRVYESKIIDPDDQSIYTDDSKPAYLIIMDKVDSPTPQQEKDWFDCCCSEDKPIYVDFTDPNGDAVVHPPVDDYDKCNKIYDDIMNIRKEVEKTGRRWVDIGIDNVGMKDGNYVLIDLGTNDPLPLNETKEIINEGFFDVLSNLFKKPEQESNTPDELNQYLQQLQDTLDENEIYDEEVSKLVDQLKDSDYIDLLDFPTMIRGLENKLLKSGDKNVIIADYLTRLLKSLPKRAKYEKNLLKGEIPSGVDYYDEVEQEKSRVPKKVFKTEKELLQIELLKLQEWVKKNNVPVAIVFEGRDTAGKGSTIKQITEYLDPKYFNIVALGIPTEEEKKNWFKRYEKYIEPGKITFFDRSWYNRGIVEPVMGYSSKEEYEQFMKEVVPFEKSLLSRGVILIKFWLSITQGKQEQRFTIRQQSPLKYWKYSPNDEASREKWDEYTEYKERVFKDTSHSESPWVVLDSNDKRVSALNAMRHILDQVDYDSKDTNIVKSKYPEAISTIRRELNEQKESTRFTNSAIKILNMAWLMSNGSFRTFTQNLIKFFNIPHSTAEELTFLCRYNIKGGNEKAEDWILPMIYESRVYVYGDYETETYYDECDSEGTTKEYGEECECLSGEIEDEDDGEYRPCTQDELDDIHYDDDCECEEWDDPGIDLYYYPVYEKTVYSTSDPDELGCVSDSHHDLDDYVECLDYSGDETVEVMEETHYEDTESVIEDEFEWDKDQTIADTWEYDIDVNNWSGDYMVNKINEIYPDKSTTLNEQQLSMFPTGEWRLPAGQESELEDLQKELPEPLVKAVFRLWDKQEPITMNDGDLKLFGIPQSKRLLIALIVRYLQNTTRPIPVNRVWDCEDLTLLFNKNDRNIVEKYLCEEDFDYDNMYGYNEWYEGMLDDLDDMSWKYITTVLGVDKSTAENLLEGKYTTEEEGEIWREKEDDIDRIKDLMRWSNERAAADTTFLAIRQDIKDEIEEHFDYTGKFDYDSKRGIVYEIKGDLKDYVQDSEVWDNTDRFNNHEEYRDRHLEDILYDFDLTHGGFTNGIPQIIFNLFMENDFAIWWDSYKDDLSVDSKYFDGYWYPNYDFNQDFREYMMDEYFEELRGNINEQVEKAGGGENNDGQLEDGDAYIERGPITKKEIQILNLIVNRFTIEELNELVTTDYNEIDSSIENKWKDFIKLFGEDTRYNEDYVKSTRWAKWALDNIEEAESVNEDGEIVFDFNNVDILTRNYPSLYSVTGDQAVWEKAYSNATVDIPAFDSKNAKERGLTNFWDYDPEFETYDWGDSDSDYFGIENVQHYSVLKEQIIDIENLPEEEISPDLVEGDKVFVWDVDPDPTPPGGSTNPIPSTFIGVVAEVIPDDVINDDFYRGGIKYVIDTTSGLIGLYQGTIMSGSWTHGFKREKEIDGIRRDKWVKLNKQNLQEIKKITDIKNIERQKDFTLKKSFMESINNLTEKDITPIKESVVESRIILFNYLDGITKTNLVKEEELPNLLIGGRTWTDRFTVSNSIDLDDIKENSNKVRDIIFHNSRLQLNHIEQPSFIDVKRNVLNESKRVVKLWASQNIS